ncbi:MAG TPA: hypothetical protein VG146_04195 [Verrucomicrobiae bacterium]|nr:hypothetical protein [Verrucomicrobiae bacterium]
MDGGARPLDGTFALSTRFEYFQAKWQTNGLLFRRINTLDDETNFAVAGQLVSWSGHKHALVEPRGELTTWNDLDPSTRGKDISIFYTSRSLLDPLREVLNMGVMYVDIGAIKWDANHFTVAARLDQEQVRVTGALFESPSQRPDHLEVCYSFPNATNRYVIRYGYGDARKSSLLPTTITNFWLKKQQNQAEREIELDEWQILDLKTQDALLPDEAFAIAPFSTQNIWVNRVYTNGGIYEWKTNGTYLLITRLDGARSIPRPPGKTATAALYSGWGTFNFLIFALMVRAKRTENNKTLKEGVLEYDIQV